MKPARIVNEALLETIRRLPCLACGVFEPQQYRQAIADDWDCKSDAHHVRTRGAGGGDTWDNLMALCRPHHQLWHRVGETEMRRRFVSIDGWFEIIFQEQP